MSDLLSGRNLTYWRIRTLWWTFRGQRWLCQGADQAAEERRLGSAHLTLLGPAVGQLSAWERLALSGTLQLVLR